MSKPYKLLFRYTWFRHLCLQQLLLGLQVKSIYQNCTNVCFVIFIGYQRRKACSPQPAMHIYPKLTCPDVFPRVHPATTRCCSGPFQVLWSRPHEIEPVDHGRRSNAPRTHVAFWAARQYTDAPAQPEKQARQKQIHCRKRKTPKVWLLAVYCCVLGAGEIEVSTEIS